MSKYDLNNNKAITGNLTRDPELRFTSTGKAVADINVAVNTRKGDKEETEFYQVTLWESLATNITESLKKGDRVVVVFYSKTEGWVDKEGNNRESEKHTALACGPELRWATAKVTKNAKETKQPDEEVEDDVPF